MLDVSKGGHHVTTLRTTRGFYPSQDPTLGQIGRFFNGNADSNVGLRAGLTKDIWTVVNPEPDAAAGADQPGRPRVPTALLKAMRTAGSSHPPRRARRSTRSGRSATRRSRGSPLGIVSHPWPVKFLLIVDPLVTWIWLGAIIIAGGGLIALWPMPVAGAASPTGRSTAPAPAPPASVPPPGEPGDRGPSNPRPSGRGGGARAGLER